MRVPRALTAQRLSTCLLLIALVLGACATDPQKAKKLRDAAAYNTQLGIAYMNQGDLARAQEKLDRAVTQDPENADVRTARAMLYVRMGEPDKAESEFHAALRLAPRDPKVVNNYAVYLCQTGHTDDGVKHFLEAARNPLYPTPQVAFTNAGVCLMAAKRDDEARADFVRALQLAPNYAEAEFQLANLQFQHGELAKARTGIDAYMTNFGANPDLLLLAVKVARAQGQASAAQTYARKLQLDFPGSDQTRALAALDHPPG